jgi:hypothetical protein
MLRASHRPTPTLHNRKKKNLVIESTSTGLEALFAPAELEEGPGNHNKRNTALDIRKLVAGTGFEFDRPGSGETAKSTKLVAGARNQFYLLFAARGLKQHLPRSERRPRQNRNRVAVSQDEESIVEHYVKRSRSAGPLIVRSLVA